MFLIHQLACPIDWSTFYVSPCVIERKAGTVVARDGGNDVTTPHDKCILIMPRRVPVKGERVLRFAREVT